MKPQWQVERALQLSDAGLNNCEIARRIGVNRRTVSDWVRGSTRLRRPPGSRRRPAGWGTCMRCSRSAPYVPGLTIHAYTYLLGIYLGDGMISSHPRGVYRSRIFLDRAYPVIVQECEAAMTIVMPASKASVYRHRHDRVDEVSSYSQHWPHLFPQHGAGVKHALTPIHAISSQIAHSTSSASFVKPATSWGSRGAKTGFGISPWLVAKPWPTWIVTLGPSDNAQIDSRRGMRVHFPSCAVAG